MMINNASYHNLTKEDLLVCTLGYEPRSVFLYEKNKYTRNGGNTLVFRLDDGRQTEKHAREMSGRGISVVYCGYGDTEGIKQGVVDFYKKHSQSKDKPSLHIDYSSMPRSWYCALPMYISELIDGRQQLFFWYNAGDYPLSYKNYPSAGIDSISVFSGLSLPAIDIKRYHMMGLGYDDIRTETIKTIVEPDALIACYAYNPEDVKTKENVYEVNKRTIDSSLLSVALPIDNFSGMVDKLCELSYDQLMQNAQVIIIPDGPKPLIMAMSLVPDIVNMPGITCLHISRNTTHYSKIPVTSRENEIYGFQVLPDSRV